MNIQGLPNEMIYDIVSKMDSCHDILNFCITNSQNKKMCQENAMYLVRKAIKTKFPQFPVKKFIEQLSRDFDRASQTSEPFSYLNGTGVYQKEFDSMPDTPISEFNSYTWLEIKNTLILILNAIKNKTTIAPDVRTEAIAPLDFVFTPTQNIKSILRHLYKREFLELTKYNFDEFIDDFIRSNWNFYKDYKLRGNCLVFKDGKIDHKIDMNKQKYILVILCKILTLKKKLGTTEAREVLKKFSGLSYEDTRTKISNYLLEKIGLNDRLIEMFFYLQKANEDEEIDEIIDKVFCNINLIDLSGNTKSVLYISPWSDESEDDSEDD